MTAFCSETQYGCEDPKCINTDQICDFESDCANGEDERVCGELGLSSVLRRFMSPTCPYKGIDQRSELNNPRISLGWVLN